MPKIVLTSKAESDLDGIYEHYESIQGAEITCTWPPVAEGVVFQILEALSRLETFPHLGKASNVPDCRQLIFAKYPYRADYQLREETIQVYRILHQHAERPQDW